MRVLHISDLHITAPFKSLEDVWHGPSAVLEQAAFDFIVVSGDLSQRAGVAEYERLQAFTERHLLPHLTRPSERARVVFVPGNHDVEWDADIGDPVRIAALLDEAAGAPLEERLRRLQRQPDASDLRLIVSRYAHLELLKLDSRRYPRRLNNLQRFLEGFYGDALARGPNRPFALLDEDDGQHFSAHVFPEHKVAFYGFSSCHKNDRHWHGAYISTKAVLNAKAHAHAHARDMLRVAVWHHGLLSERGRPDHLTLQDIGLLHNAGFRIGFHGHTHQAAFETFDRLFQDRFVIVATGSLGAGSAERPDAVGNQFSVVRLYPGQVDVQVFERNGTTGSYAPNPARKRLYLMRPEEESRADQAGAAAEHERVWTVDRDGIADVQVTLRQLRVNGELTLALVAPPFCAVSAAPTASTPVGAPPVTRTDLPDGRVRFTLGGDVLLPTCTWRYQLSNAVALHQADLRLLEPRERFMPNLEEGCEGRAHTVWFPCDRLTLAVHFVETDAEVIEAGSARAVVERRVDERGIERWERAPSEEARCAVTGDGRRVALAVEAPVLGYRYTLAFRPAQKGVRLPSEALRLAREILHECRAGRTEGASLSNVLARTVEASVRQGLNKAELGPQAALIGMIWHERRRRLFTAFGQFPNQSWGARFAAGSGIAGHAFRFGCVTSWHQDDASRLSLVYQARTDAGEQFAQSYRWIVCVPIVIAPKGPAIGVVSLASAQVASRGENLLHDFADDAGRGLNRDRGVGFQNALMTCVNTAFWHTLTAGPWLSSGQRNFARRTARVLGLPTIVGDPVLGELATR